ncbi:acyl-CoA thioesterase [Bacillus massilinigeriensis]|uniref:acyl-CoA thioesterase n=1 Tax=Bacillus massilionigeriensis TaxID=1805475 RepID=UPI00096B50A3|nr:thioesterase family protein [Bacillus massilionigeriensis]
MSRINYINDFNQWESEFEFYYEVKVRFSETDMFGHLNNTVPFIYFESARIEYFNSLGFMQEWVTPENETIPVVADLQCDYLKQVFYGEELKVFVKAAKIGNTSVDIHYLVKNQKEQTCIVGRGTVVQMSKITGKGVPWSEEMIALFQKNQRVGV